ncbi:uncharacterized protein M6G45_015627 isoform 2-T2 [Spheniscus humboldti]
MQAEAVKQELCTLQERLAQCSAESQRHKELLRSLVGVECSPCPRGLGPQTLSPCSPFPMQEEMHEDLRGAIEKLNSEVLRQEIKKLEEALEQEETCQQQRKKEAEAPGTVLPEVVEAQLERDMLARRRGFFSWLQTLCLLLVGLELVVGFALAAAVLYASWYDREFFYRLLLRVLPEETYTHLAYALGRILPVVSEGLLPF